MTDATAPAPAGDVLLRVENLVKHYPVRVGVLVKREVASVKAVDGVDLELRRGETLGLVGETGSGKSTLARCIAGLHPVTSGHITFDGRDITNLPRQKMQPFRRDIQMIFQDPYGSLNPRRRVGSIIGDPFTVHKIASGDKRKRLVQELMERVGLNPEHYNPYTQALLAAAPAADPDEADSRQRIILVGDVPSPLLPPPGCRFHPRCPKAQELCSQVVPPLEVKSGDPETHRTACHFPVETGEDLARAADMLRDRAEPGLG